MFVVMGSDEHRTWFVDWSGNLEDCLNWKAVHEREHPKMTYKIYKLEEVLDTKSST